MDLTEISTAALIKKLKDDPTNSSYLSELNYRLDTDEYSDIDLINLFDAVLSIKGESNNGRFQ